MIDGTYNETSKQKIEKKKIFNLNDMRFVAQSDTEQAKKRNRI